MDIVFLCLAYFFWCNDLHFCPCCYKGQDFIHFMDDLCIMVFMYHIFFIDSSADGHLFAFPGYVNSVQYMWKFKIFLHTDFMSFGYILRVEFLDHIVVLFFNFWRNYPIVSHKQFCVFTLTKNIQCLFFATALLLSIFLIIYIFFISM
jgi:hypothetical protein